MLPAVTAPLTDTGVSEPDGYCEAPAELTLVSRRMSVPPAQRFPSPKTASICVVPWKYNAALFGIPLPSKTNESAARLACTALECKAVSTAATATARRRSERRANMSDPQRETADVREG